MTVKMDLYHGGESCYKEKYVNALMSNTQTDGDILTTKW